MENSLTFSPYSSFNACGGGIYPTSMHVPKFGMLVPNRIFVGGIANDTTENELKHFFSAYGNVRDCKVILDRGGLSKSYGFVTFETQEDAENVLKGSGDNLIIRDRKLNIGPAIRKQGLSGGRHYGGGEPGLGVGSSLSSCNMAGGASAGLIGGSGAVYPNALSYHTTAALGNQAVTLMCIGDGYLVPAQPAQTLYPSLVYHSQTGYYQSPVGATTPNISGQWPNTAATPTHWRWPNVSQQTTSTSLIASPCGQYVYQIPGGNSSGATASGPGPVMGPDVLFAQSAVPSSAYHQSASNAGDMMSDQQIKERKKCW